MPTVATPKRIQVGTDVTVVAKPTNTASFNRLVRVISAQNADPDTDCTIALYIGPSATGIMIGEWPLAKGSGGVVPGDYSTKGENREKEFGLAIVDATNVQQDLVAKVTSAGTINVYINVLTQTGGGGH